jgi:NAD(P)-dependent dehydrogenase (short-subunit alcohol dehydrogenase family)
MKVANNLFIVTGGAGGIGKAVSSILTSKGALVALFDVLDSSKGTEVAKSIGDKAVYVQVDITESDSVKKGIETAQQHFAKQLESSGGKLSGCVHCAGIAIKQEWTNNMVDSIPNFEKMLKVNTVGTFVINAHVADAINAQYPKADGERFFTTDEERGIIVNFASVAGHDLYARCLSYGPTKAAVLGMTRSFADFLGPSGIRVCSVSPSIVISGLTAGFSGYFQDDLTAHAAFPRSPVPAEKIVDTVLHLIENQCESSSSPRCPCTKRTLDTSDLFI